MDSATAGLNFLLFGSIIDDVLEDVMFVGVVGFCFKLGAVEDTADSGEFTGGDVELVDEVMGAVGR